MHEIDCLGDMCPIPIMKLKQCREIKEHGCVVESIGSYCRKMHLKMETVEPMNGIWELYITV